MRNLSRAFLTGLVAILPIAITIAILVWLGGTAETALGGLIKLVLPAGFYSRGMGLAAGVVVIFLFGLSLQAWVVRRIFAYGEKLLQRIPVIKTLYGSARDLIGFFSESKAKSLSQVVMVRLGDTGLRVIGFVTREDFSAYPKGLAAPDTIAVYLPMSYQVGGFTALLPRSVVEPVEMSFQDAMRFALTAGMSSGEKDSTINDKR
jgi:uncharacterized membrane protein